MSKALSSEVRFNLVCDPGSIMRLQRHLVSIANKGLPPLVLNPAGYWLWEFLVFPGLERQEQGWQATDKVLVLVLVLLVVAQQRVSHGQESPLKAGDLDEGRSV